MVALVQREQLVLVVLEDLLEQAVGLEHQVHRGLVEVVEVADLLEAVDQAVHQEHL
jgi:hypothetical protein